MYNEALILSKKHEALRLARILFNYRDAFSGVAGQLDKEKLDILMKVVSSEKIPPSVNSTGSERSNESESDESRTNPLLYSVEVKSLLCPSGTFRQGTTVRNIHLQLIRV